MLKNKGFALPTVLISSIVMLIVLLSGLVSVSSIDTALEQQYLNRLLKEAGQSGVALAQACLIKTGTPQWTDASPLRPDSGCSGSGSACAASTCYLVDNTNTKTTFTAGTPVLNSDGSYTIKVTGMLNLYSTSTSTIKTTSTDTFQAKVRIGWKQISAGEWYACGIALNDVTYCWGFNGDGQLGTGNTTSIRAPAPVDMTGVLAGKTIKQLATSLNTTCAIASDDKAYCWGYNGSYYGALGNNSAVNNSVVPVAVYTGGVLNGKTINKIAGGGHHFCVIDSDGKAYCWGENVVGELGNNTTTTNATPAPVAVYNSGVLATKSLSKITIGRNHTCALATTFTAYCWGYGYYGQLANGGSSSSSIPLAVSTGSLSGKNVVDINAGYYHTCAVTSDGLASCWGENADGQVGNGGTATVYTPVAVTSTGALSGKTVTQIDAGYHSTCATASSRAFCWGNNSNGQLGNNTTTGSTVPVAVDTSGVLNNVNIASVTTADNQATSYAIGTNNRFYGFGSNYGFNFGYWQQFATDSSVPVIGGTTVGTVFF